MNFMRQKSRGGWRCALGKFIRGVTDAGKPRAAKGGLPYPGHSTLEDQRLALEIKQACAAHARTFIVREKAA